MVINKSKITVLFSLLVTLFFTILLMNSLGDNILLNNDQLLYLITSFTNSSSYDDLLLQFLETSPNEYCKSYEINTLQSKYYFNYPFYSITLKFFQLLQIKPFLSIICTLLTVNFFIIFVVVYNLIYNEKYNFILRKILTSFFYSKLIYLSLFSEIKFTKLSILNVLKVIITLIIIYNLQPFILDLTIARMASILFIICLIHDYKKNKKINLFFLVLIFNHLLVGTVGLCFFIIFIYDYSRKHILQYLPYLIIFFNFQWILTNFTNFNFPNINFFYAFLISFILVLTIYKLSKLNFLKVFSNKIITSDYYYLAASLLIIIIIYTNKFDLTSRFFEVNAFIYLKEYVIIPFAILLIYLRYTQINNLPIIFNYLISNKGNLYNKYLNNKIIILVILSAATLVNSKNHSGIITSYNSLNKFYYNKEKSQDCDSKRTLEFLKELYLKS